MSGAELASSNVSISPSLWVAHSDVKALVTSRFKETTFIEYKPLIAANLEFLEKKLSRMSDLSCFSQSFQNENAADRLLLIENILARTDSGNSYSAQELEYTANRYYAIAQLLFEYSPPSFIFFRETPHLPCDLAIYLMAKRLGIRVFFPSYTCAVSASFIVEDINAPFKPILIPGLHKENQKLIEESVKPILKSISSKQSLPYMKTRGYLASEKHQRSLGQFMNGFFRVLLGSIRYYGLLKLNLIRRPNYHKKKGRPLWRSPGNTFHLVRHYIQAWRLELFYRSRVEDLDISCLKNKYIYVPLAMQKELTTMPMAGHLHDQRLVVQWLLRNIPDDIVVVVKENPKQFKHVTGISYRSKEFYEELLQEGAVFCGLDVPSAYLIENACAVAVTTGTAGFESAYLYDKPVFCFAHVWYENLPVVHLMKTGREDLGNLLKNRSVHHSAADSERVTSLFASSVYLNFKIGLDGQHFDVTTINFSCILQYLYGVTRDK